MTRHRTYMNNVAYTVTTPILQHKIKIKELISGITKDIASSQHDAINRHTVFVYTVLVCMCVGCCF